VTVYAAGVLCWRERSGVGFEVALVHRAKYNDWGFAKGKQDPGELLPETAVREVFEETGLKVRLGRKLAEMHYTLPTGEDKEVHYWASKVTDKSILNSSFKPNEEIARVEWLPAAEALVTLSYEHDRELLEKALRLHERGELETRALIVLRHAKATPRSEWESSEKKRPLLPEGEKQAKRLANLLAAYGPKRVVTSPWKRCHDTVVPYAKLRKRAIVERGQLTEASNAKGPRKTTNVIEDLLEDSKTAVVCTHRPALPNVLDALAKVAQPAEEILLNEGRALKPGDFLIARLAMRGQTRVLAVENCQLP
jgi:8-oxo-(d)GTP phosphatase